MNNSAGRLLLSIVLATLILVAAGCATDQDGRDQGAAKEGKKESGEKPAPRKKPPPAPEPARSPPLEEDPAGKVVEVGPEPEGIVADPETNLVAVSLRGNGRMALLDGETDEVVREAKIKGSGRHLALVAPGGPVLVPAERADSLVQVGLPEGEVQKRTKVGDFPHDVAAYDGRIFVANEFDSTASVIEDGRVVETFETPFQPGNVAATADGLVGAVGVRGLALEVYDADTLKSLGRVDAGEGPTHLVAGSEGRFYVTDTRGDAVLVYETRPEPRQVGRVPVSGGAPYGIAIDLARDRLWVTLTANNRLDLYDLSDGSPRKVSSYPTVRQPNGVTVDLDSGRVFVAGTRGGEVQILDPE